MQRSAARSNQGIDIFKKRMEEAFASPDQLKFELQNSNLKHTKNTLLQVSLLLLVLLIFFGGVYAVKVLSSKPVFCSPGFTSDCRTCPEFSICEKGEFQCVKNYIREGYECVEDQAITQKAYVLIHKTEEYIVEKSIKQYLADRSRFYATITEIKYLFKDSDSVHDRFIELLIGNKSQRLTMEFYNGEEVFYAKPPFLDVVSLMKIFWEENFYYLVVGVSLFLMSVYKLIRLKQERLLRGKANHMYELIRNQLRANIDDTPEHGVPEETLKEAIVGHLGAQTASTLWPAIENLRKNDKQVSKFEISLAGRPQILWQWKDVRSVKPISNK